MMRGGKVREELERKRHPVIKPPPTLHIRRHDGNCSVTYAPPGKKPQHFDYPVDSDASDLELDITMPAMAKAPPPPLKHQAQQFCDEDFPPIITKSNRGLVSQKKKDKKDKKNKKQKKEKTDGIVIRPWDEWIMKFKCSDDMKLFRLPKKKGKKDKGKSAKEASKAASKKKDEKGKQQPSKALPTANNKKGSKQIAQPGKAAATPNKKLSKNK